MPAPASALHLVPAGMVLAIGGHDGMVARAAETGQAVHVRPIPESDHFQLITPGHETWETVVETILQALNDI